MKALVTLKQQRSGTITKDGSPRTNYYLIRKIPVKVLRKGSKGKVPHFRCKFPNGQEKWVHPEAVEFVQ